MPQDIRADRQLHETVAQGDTHEDQTSGVVGYFYRSYIGEVKAFLKTSQPKRVLDLGCGEGVLTRDVGILAIRLDLSLTRLARAKKYGSGLVCADAYDLPLADQSCDAVLMVALLEHTWHPQKVLDEVHRVLVSGGGAVVLVPNDINMSIGRVLLGKWPPRYPDHLSFITPSRLARWIEGRFVVERGLRLPFTAMPFGFNMYYYALLRKIGV